MRLKIILVFVILLAGTNFVQAGMKSSAHAKKLMFVPPAGKVLLIVGEDKLSTDAYVSSIGIVPGGTMLYTSIQDTSSLTSAFDNGGGIQDGQYLLDAYPNSVIQVGLWMVGALEDTISGKYDKNIDKLGAWIVKARRPVFLRIGYEFDLPANHYDPANYREAFRYIVTRLRQNKVDNVAFVWHSYGGNQDKIPLEAWYPGNHYVDWFGVSIFHKPDVYIRNFADTARLQHKPLMIAESAPMGSGTLRGLSSWNGWFKSFFQYITVEKVQIVCYCDLNWNDIPMFKSKGWGDSRVQDNEIVRQKWLEEISSGKYLNASPDLFKILTEPAATSSHKRK